MFSDINQLFSSHENLVYKGSFGIGFMWKSFLVLEWEHFENILSKIGVLPVARNVPFLTLFDFRQNGQLYGTLVTKQLFRPQLSGRKFASFLQDKFPGQNFVILKIILPGGMAFCPSYVMARTASLLWTRIFWRSSKFLDKLSPLFKFE